MRVVLGISGGVDSSVAGYLLKQQGHDVIGLFMVNWEEQDGACTAEVDYEDVKRVCNALHIPYFSVNYAKEYYDRVFTYFLDEYKKGRTPNPDVLCNREIKFGPFLDKAMQLGADMIATGHYARKIEKDGKYYLAKASDLSKDQSYFLNQLSQKQLSKVIFPLEDIEKTQVREIAKKLDLSTAEKKDSTGICFIGERNFKKFLKGFLPAQPGDMVDLEGNVIGKHDGLMYYTLGQRRGLNIGGKAGGNGERWFVIEKDLKNNRLIVSQGEGEELFSDGLYASQFNWIPQVPEQKEFDCYAKFRYRQPDQKVKIQIIDDTHVKIDFVERQRAITPGQFAVLYDENGLCLGGGVIDESYNKKA